MMNWKVLNQNWIYAAALVVSTLIFLAAWFGQARAMTLWNEDLVPYEVRVVTESGLMQDVFTIDGGEVASEICNDGCILVLPNGEPYPFAADDEVSIRGGVFVLME